MGEKTIRDNYERYACKYHFKSINRAHKICVEHNLTYV